MVNLCLSVTSAVGVQLLVRVRRGVAACFHLSFPFLIRASPPKWGAGVVSVPVFLACHIQTESLFHQQRQRVKSPWALNYTILRQPQQQVTRGSITNADALPLSGRKPSGSCQGVILVFLQWSEGSLPCLTGSRQGGNILVHIPQMLAFPNVFFWNRYFFTGSLPLGSFPEALNGQYGFQKLFSPGGGSVELLRLSWKSVSSRSVVLKQQFESLIPS